MKEENITPLRERMIEDMRIRGMSLKTQQAHIRAVRYFAEFIGRSPYELSKVADRSDMGLLGLQRHTANAHVLDHPLTQRGDVLLFHKILLSSD